MKKKILFISNKKAENIQEYLPENVERLWAENSIDAINIYKEFHHQLKAVLFDLNAKNVSRLKLMLRMKQIDQEPQLAVFQKSHDLLFMISSI
ncbi:hypothetical protein ACFL96_03805 [Thermoproteota archaeon]